MTNNRSALRETRVLLIIFAMFCAWVVLGSYWLGYPEETGGVATVFGFPAWIAWCIAIPWLLANVATIWFAMSFMKNEDLETENQNERL